MSDVTRPRPSSAERWCGAGCPGSVALAARYPQTTNAAAENGTRLHGLAATALTGGERIYGAEDAKVVDPYVADVLREHWGRPQSELRVERKAQWHLNPLLEGTPDAALLDPLNQRLIIWDLKTGWRLIEAFENWQLLCYAVMLALQGWTIELRIAQPLPYHPEGSIRSWVLSYDDLQQRAIKIALALNEATKPDAIVRPGAHCLYCDALVGCPAARSVSLGAVEYAANEPVELPNEHIGRELQVLRDTVKILQLRLGALEESTAAKLRGGEKIPGVVVREGKGGRTKWIDEEAARATIRMLTGSDPAVPSLPTPTQLKNAGLSDAMLRPLTRYQPGKMVVSTDADNQAKKIFNTEPNMEHTR